MVIKLKETLTLHYTAEPYGNDEFDYEVDQYKWVQDNIFDKLSEEEKIEVLKKYDAYDPQYDVDDSLYNDYDLIDQYIEDNDLEDQMEEYYKEEAWDQYDYSNDYEREMSRWYNE